MNLFSSHPLLAALTRRLAMALLLALGAASLSGCLPRRAITTPMERIADPVRADQRSDTLLVLLPGAFDVPNDFVREGFVDAVRARRIDADVLMMDAHTEYYMQRIVLDRLLDEVVRPARGQGYRTIWFAGISLGGYGSLLFAKEHGELIDGVFVMAAFLGRRDIPAAVAAAGGLGNWQPSATTPDDPDRYLWQWLTGYAQTPTGAFGRPPLYVGYGRSDRFAGSNELLARELPESRVFTTEGGHDWGPWRRLWDAFLDRAPLPRLNPS